MLSAGQHTLIKQPDTEDLNKHCILVKLTDSSAKAIEEYIKNKNNTTKKPNIVFTSDKTGEISLPTESTNLNFKKFFFSLSGVKESNKDISAALECIHYNNNKLKTIGNVEHKLTVQANEELFQATKEKVNKEAEEEKKNSTIEIKHSGAIVNRNLSSSAKVQRNSIGITKVNNNPNQDVVKLRNPVLERPLKERLIHLLALKPLNKAELLLKLGKDYALNEKDKEQMDLLLQSITMYNHKNLTYEISNEVLLNEVKEDWQFYNQSEKLIVKNKISKLKEKMASKNQQNNSFGQKSSLSSSNKASAFSAPSSSGNKSINLSSNFETNLDELDSSIDKSISKRISPHKPEQFKPINKNHRPSSQTSTYLKEASDLFSTSSDEMSADDLSFSSKQTNGKDEFIGAKKHKIDFEYKERAQEIEGNELKECQRKYKKITSPQQKQQYMQDYDQIYKEYLELHFYIDNLRDKFEKLRSDLGSLNESSREYTEKKQKIINDYVDKKSDSDYLKKRDRYSQVYTKLKYLHNILKESGEL
ncbi:RNA polymerase II elongation factor Ell [Brachionus plicatilis]|uniref:RNA polymerase II elongation factor Ell n=1 Tax=Brachionus plicatilis TaxID=10195 RepID=A0A3M7T689_BRAPC|nr:RNA polymerase II elongation factor Ell [Brachionus plicatilis]